MSGILCAIMFVSGAAALSFETLWFRQAGLAFGNGVWASSLVLTSFMAGLALGNGLLARYGERIARPLRFYGMLEIAIGATGVVLVWVLPLFGAWLVPLWALVLDEPWLLNSLRLTVAFGMLIVPATAMGATLPVLVKALRARDPNFGSVLGRLYGWNTLGAVVGALVGEAFLIEFLGVRGTALATASLNGVAAVGAIMVANRIEVGMAAPAPEPAPGRLRRTSTATRCLLAAALLSGAILLALEVVWFRLLHLFVYDTSLSFALVLAVVLAGIGCGGALAGAWLRREPDGFGTAAPIALLAGAAVAFCYRGFADAVAPYASQVIRAAPDIAWLSAALMFPVSLLSGILFTVTGAALEREVAPATRATGWLTLANTLGGGLGAMAAGFWLLTSLGVEASIFCLAALYVAVAVLLLAASAWRKALATRLLVAAFAWIVALAVFPSGQMQSRFIETLAARMGEPGAHLAGFREGRTETVVYLRSDLQGEPMHYRLVTGGFGMASTVVWARRYMKQFVYWPIALHPKSERALLISFGIGNTAKALTETKSLEHIDVVDISRDVLAMSDIPHSDPATHPLRDPRVEVHVEDGRFFLLTATQGYDLITSEPPPPKHAGIVNLYTREYFQLIFDRLNEGGINTYWLPVHSLLLEDTLAIIRSYCDVFEDCSLWTGAGLNWMLAGSRNAAWSRSEEDFARQWTDPVVGPELRALGFERPEQLGATFLADAEQLRGETRDVLPLTDDFPKRLTDRTDFRNSRLEHAPWLDSDAARERFASSRFIRNAWPEELRRDSLEYFSYQDMIDRSRGVRVGPPPGSGARVRDLHRALTEGRLRTLPMWWLGVDQDQIDAVERHLEGGAPMEDHAFRLGALALVERDFNRAATLFDRAATEGQRPKLMLYLRLYAHCMAGDVAAAQKIADEKFDRANLSAGDRSYLGWLAETFGLAS